MQGSAREPLTSERIIDAALRIIDDEGLRALTMRRLGQALGVEAMSLYHHLPGKAAVLSGVAEALLSGLRLEATNGGSWQDRMRQLARAYRGVAHAHPNAFPLIVMRERQTPQVTRLFDLTARICRDAGASDDDALNVFLTLGGFVSGFALFEIGGFFTLTGEPSPNLADCQPLASAGSERSLAPGDAQFELGVTTILAGLAEQFARRAAGAGANPA
ncbi:MAG TPA: TetR/AcrR family transcriptional regulator C-terminal domain-containing protein [Thermomicrobiales bacterium]|nr:TetR/AcrR family transcriptional regulator C-terminal domain-containing protein [Thermomicrobiales bacterium]